MIISAMISPVPGSSRVSRVVFARTGPVTSDSSSSPASWSLSVATAVGARRSWCPPPGRASLPGRALRHPSDTRSRSSSMISLVRSPSIVFFSISSSRMLTRSALCLARIAAAFAWRFHDDRVHLPVDGLGHRCRTAPRAVALAVAEGPQRRGEVRHAAHLDDDSAPDRVARDRSEPGLPMPLAPVETSPISSRSASMPP